MTVAELEGRMGAGEYAMWQRYAALEPFGQERDNWHMAVLAQMYASVHKGKNKPNPTIKQFMWGTGESCKQDETKATLLALEAMAKKKRL